MKVLIINRDVGTGSIGKICVDLYNGLRASGNECKVAYAWNNKSTISSYDLFKFNDLNTIRFNALLSRFFDNDGLRSKKATYKLIDYIKVYSPDIVHIHSFYGYYINFPILFDYLKKSNIKVVNTLHSCWDFTGHCCYFTRVRCDKWKNQCSNCIQKKSYPKSIFLDRSRRNYDIKKKTYANSMNLAIVTPSLWLSNLVSESILCKHNTFVINNGINLDIFKPTIIDLKKYNIDERKKIILGVASIWDERKGLNDFIELSNVIDDSYQIVLIGITEKQQKKLPPSIICIRRTENAKELAGFYTAALVFFNPTYEDNYPTVNLESIACGTPVVTYNTGGSPESVIKYNFGKVIEKKDYKSLLFFLKELKEKKYVFSSDINELSFEKMVNDYITLYKNLILKG